MKSESWINGIHISLAGIIFACVVALVVGALCGIFNGFLVSFLNIPPMLATLGSYELYMGISIVLSKGSTVSANGQFNILSAIPGILPKPPSGLIPPKTATKIVCIV